MNGLRTTLILAMVMSQTVFATGRQGIPIKADEDGLFEYVDNFDSPRFLIDGFVSDIRPEQWGPGSLQNRGPYGFSVTYRFHGDRVITDVDIQVDQHANGPNSGGYNDVYLSRNGLDWQPVAGSHSIKPDGNGGQGGILGVSGEQAVAYLGGPEIWLRLVLRNTSGLATNTSNSISKLGVRLKVGALSTSGADPQQEARATWGQLRQKAEWRSISLDADDPVDQRGPHYYEDADGWLVAPGESVHLAPDETAGFPIRRAHGGSKRLALSLVSFVKTKRANEPLMARITVRGTKDASRNMTVRWDGTEVGAFDTGSYFDSDKVILVTLPGQQKSGSHELRIAGEDGRSVLVRQIVIAGGGEPQWTTKPELPKHGKLQLLDAYFMPDPAPPPDSQAVEGRHELREAGLIFRPLQKLYNDHADFGALRVHLRNIGRVPARISDPVMLNGEPIESHYVDFVKSEWDARGVVWYRVRPRTVEPGRCAELYVRFRRKPAREQAEIELKLANGKPVKVNVPYEDPGVSLDYVTTDVSMATLYVYARRSAGQAGEDVGSLTALFLNGEKVKSAKVYGADFPGNLALVVAELERPLSPGDYHVIGVQTGRRRTVSSQFRVLPFVYPRSSIHVPSSICRQMHMNLAMWHMHSLETCLKHDLYTTGGDIFNAHERVSYILGVDEPDAHDNRGGGYERGLGYHGRRLIRSGWQELIERFAPGAASWIIMNGTTRPLNWFIYGQMADIACFDPYPINFYAADHTFVGEGLSLVQRCGAPRRTYGCMEAFGWNPGQGVPDSGRGPSPVEYRQNIIQGIGAGMKGLTSWVHSGSAGGWGGNKAAGEEIAKVNALIEHIEEELLLATPIDLATSDAGTVMTGVVGDERWPKDRVSVRALLSGPDAIVVTATNHIPASKPDPPAIEPARDVMITVNLPEYLPDVSAFEATENGVAPMACEVHDGKAILKLEKIESGRVFLLRRS